VNICITTSEDLNEAKELPISTESLYNEQRPHLSCAMHVPEAIHLQKYSKKNMEKLLQRTTEDV